MVRRARAQKEWCTMAHRGPEGHGKWKGLKENKLEKWSAKGAQRSTEGAQGPPQATVEWVGNMGGAGMDASLFDRTYCNSRQN